MAIGKLALGAFNSTRLCHSSRHKHTDGDLATGHTLDGEDVHDWGAPWAPHLGPRRDHGGAGWGGHLCVCWLCGALAGPLPQAAFQGTSTFSVTI